MKRKNNSFEEFTFHEEVPEKDLYDKHDVNDLIYVKDKHYRKRINALIALAIFLIVSALLLSLFGLVFMNKDIIWQKSENKLITYNLFVSHSNTYYGRNAINFENYNSYDKALEYTFDVKNANPIDLNYKVILNNPYFGEDNVEMNFISYELIINNKEISSGKLKNQDKVTLSSNTIANNDEHNVILKLWSSELKKDSKFNFKIDVIS